MKKNKKQIVISNIQQDLPASKLFQLAQQKNQQMNDQQAGYYYSLAYKKDPQNDLILLCYADYLKSNNQLEKSKSILQKSIKQKPNGTYKRYFQLAQLYDGIQSIQIFEKGIQTASNINLQQYNLFEINKLTQKQVRRDIANAYAAIAQVCMTDLINQKQAEVKCVESLKKGEQIDINCMDIQLQKSNYLLFKDDDQTAKTILLGIYQNIKKAQENQYYSDQLKHQTVRYLIQVKCFEEASQILLVLNETGKDLQLVYLLAYCYFNLKKYSKCLQQLDQYEQLSKQAEVDPQIAEAAAQLKQQLQKIDQKQFGEPQETGEAEDEDWMDIQDGEQN